MDTLTISDLVALYFFNKDLLKTNYGVSEEVLSPIREDLKQVNAAIIREVGKRVKSMEVLDK